MYTNYYDITEQNIYNMLSYFKCVLNKFCNFYTENYGPVFNLYVPV